MWVYTVRPVQTDGTSLYKSYIYFGNVTHYRVAKSVQQHIYSGNKFSWRTPDLVVHLK